MSLQRNKILLIICFLTLNLSYAQKQYIRKITSDITEFDRKSNKTKFLSNVKIETYDGYILCDKTEYNGNKLFCESNVIFVYTPSESKYHVVIQCGYLDYDIKQQLVKFYKDVSVVYRSSVEMAEGSLASSYISSTTILADNVIFDIQNKNMICKNNVVITVEDNKIFCSIVEYQYEEGIVKINHTTNTPKEQLLIVSDQKKYKIKTCRANNALIDQKQNRVVLTGKVEVIF